MVQSGFNHNIRYKKVLFHVQTEDYGTQKHTIVTQIFFGGTLVAKAQMDYTEFLDLDDISEQVRELMKVQHIKTLKDLVNGRVEIPEWVFGQAESSEKNNKPTLDLDENPRSERFEITVSRFLEDEE